MSNLDVDVQTVCAMVRARMVPQGRTIIAIAGPPASGKSTLAEEMSDAYKDINEVVDVVHGAGISRKVARLRPLGVIKG